MLSTAIRPEDRVIVQADERSNAIIVTTSPRSFAVLEGLLRTLDSEIAPDLREIRGIEVKHASATRLARLVQELMDVLGMAQSRVGCYLLGGAGFAYARLANQSHQPSPPRKSVFQRGLQVAHLPLPPNEYTAGQAV